MTSTERLASSTKYRRMPSQIDTTLGSYATAPTQIVRLMVFLPLRCGLGDWCGSIGKFARPAQPSQSLISLPSKKRHSQDRLRNELAKDVARRRHDGAGVSVAEQPLDIRL